MAKSVEQQYRDEGIKMGLQGQDEVPFTTKLEDTFFASTACIEARKEGIKEGLAARPIALALGSNS